MTLKTFNAAKLLQSAIFGNFVELEVNFNHIFPPNSTRSFNILEPIDLTFSKKLHLLTFQSYLTE